MVALCSHLRKVRDADYLHVLCHAAEHRAHLASNVARNAGIDFVKDNRRQFGRAREDVFEREHQA